ncbi:hypothetical protein C8J56DRAFT_1054589 [Mycena floridula]|nr:hypothetical protein C8J56DRAFT_1054589 [Mycena floridula]
MITGSPSITLTAAQCQRLDSVPSNAIKVLRMDGNPQLVSFAYTVLVTVSHNNLYDLSETSRTTPQDNARPVRERSLSEVSFLERDLEDSLFARVYEVDEESLFVRDDGLDLEARTVSWRPLFHADKSMSTTFETLLRAIFHHVDVTNSDYFSPKVYDRLLKDMGYIPNNLIWERNLDNTLPDQGISKADTALANWYRTFDIDMRLVRRPSGSLMPMISEQGFMDLTAQNALTDPEFLWRGLSKVLRKYHLLQTRGPLPRRMLPAKPDAQTVQQVLSAVKAAEAKGVTMNALY